MVELLGRVRLFADLSEQELEPIAQVAIPRSFPAETTVFHDGDHGEACYIIRRGRCRAIRHHSDGRAITLAHFGVGDFFGELAMIDPDIRSATVETVEETALLALTGADMRRLLRDYPEISLKLLVALARRLRQVNDRVARQSFQTVPSRVAGVLLQLIAEQDSAAASGGEGVTIKMTQADLAQLAGASRETVSRFLATLERAGVVVCGRGRVTVREPQRLQAYIF